MSRAAASAPMGGAPRIGCLLVPDIRLRVHERGRPELDGHPFAVIEEGVVIAVSQAAERASIRPGATIAEARARLGDLIFVEADAPGYRAAFGRVIARLSRLSSRLQAEAPDLVYLDASPEQGRSAGERALLEAMLEAGRVAGSPRAAIASSLFAARAAARFGPEAGTTGTLVPPGSDRDFLAPLPIEALPLEEFERDALRLAGIRTLGALGGLPAASLGERFGSRGPMLARLARGEDRTPLAVRRKRTNPGTRLSFEPPLASGESLVRAVQRLLARLAARLLRQGLACRVLVLRLALEGRPSPETVEVRLAEPTASLGTLGPLVRLRLSSLSLAAPLQGISLVARKTVPATVRAPALFEKGRDCRPRAAVEARVLERAVAFELRDAHLPERRAHAAPFCEMRRSIGARMPAREIAAASGSASRRRLRAGFRALLPPRPVEVRADGHDRPLFLRAGPFRGPIVARAGPFRLAAEGALRDYYDAALAGGALVRLFRDLVNGGWFLCGIHD